MVTEARTIYHPYVGYKKRYTFFSLFIPALFATQFPRDLVSFVGHA